MILTADIDNFYLVKWLRSASSPLKRWTGTRIPIPIYIHLRHTPEYIPRELLNVTHIRYIDFSIFATNNYYYERKTASLNHNKLNWYNMINLVGSNNISEDMYEIIKYSRFLILKV